MKLLLLRHAEAEPHSAADFSRKLTEKGESQARKVGKFCAEHKLVPDVIFTSPLCRAEQTARLAAHEMDGVEVIVAQWLASGMQPEDALEELRALKRFQSIMIVGHEPDFSMLASALLGITHSSGVNVRKSSLICLAVDFPRKGSATLDFSVPVKFM